jgi:small subunit ribosomal protein S6
MKKFYEIVFIVRQDAASNLVESIASDVTKVVKDSGGDITKTEFCGLRHFAYPIKKNKRGHYVLLNISCDGSVIAEIERRLRINENVLRYLSVLVDSLDNTPSALMQNRHYRENVCGAEDENPTSQEKEIAKEVIGEQGE